jgi:ribonuclease HII
MLKSRYKYDNCAEAGLDEAGRGCLWGPFYAAAVIWKDESEWTDEIRSLSEKIKDSKKISEKKRNLIYEGILKHAESYGIGIVTSQEIDSWGMTKANRTAFERALANLSKQPQRILIDGCLAIDTSTEQIVEPQLDNTYICVAAASIIAKVSRDRAVQEMVKNNTNLDEKYDLANNKGYGTLKHRNGILKNGKHELHRNLFLRKLLKSSNIDNVSNNTQDTTCAFLEEN